MQASEQRVKIALQKSGRLTDQSLVKCRAMPNIPELRLRSYITVTSTSAPAINVPPVTSTAIARSARSASNPTVQATESGRRPKKNMRIVSIPEVGRCLAAVAVATFLIGCSPRSAEPEKFDSGLDSSQVEAAGETLRGEVLDSDAQLTVFRGIPFAAAPVAKLRWQPPRSHTPREGIQQATQFGGVCPQGQGNADFYMPHNT